MGASQNSVCHSCLAPAEPGNDDAELPSTAGREDDFDIVQVKRRVQAVTNIDYGPAGMVTAGATGRVAFPRLDRVSVRSEQLTFIAEEKVGPHIMTRNAAVTPTAALSREALEMLPAGMHVEVLEVVHRKVEKRWRGRIERPVRGWISLVSSEDGHRWASPSRPSRTSFVGMQPAMGPAGSALGSSGGPRPQAAPAAAPPAAQQPAPAQHRQAPAAQLQVPAPRQQAPASPQQLRQQAPALRQQAPALRQQVQSNPPVVVMPGANSRSASFNYGTSTVQGRTSHAASFHLGESSSTTASTPWRPQDSSYRRPSFNESSERRLVYRQESGSASIPTVRPEEVSRLASELRTPRRVEPAPGAELPAGGWAAAATSLLAPGGGRVEPAPGAELPARGWAAAATSLLAPGGGVERRDSQASDVTKAPEDILNKGVRSVPEGPIINGAPKRDQMFALGADPVGEQWQQGHNMGGDLSSRTARTEALGPELYMH